MNFGPLLARPVFRVVKADFLCGSVIEGMEKDWFGRLYEVVGRDGTERRLKSKWWIFLLLLFPFELFWHNVLARSAESLGSGSGGRLRAG